MWQEFFRFELRYQLRQPLLWVTAFFFGLLAFGAFTSDAVTIGGGVGNVFRNAPMVIAQTMGIFTVLAMFLITVFIAGAVLRDTEFGISDMIFATPMTKLDYLLGRFLAGMVACLAIFAVIAIGMMLGPVMPWVDAARVAEFSLGPYLWSFAVFVIPNLFIVGSLLMLLSAITRSMFAVYVGVLLTFILWSIAGILARDVSNDWLTVLIDPFGLRAFARITRYFSPAEANAGLPEIAGFFLANRALWLVVAAATFAATVALFQPQREGTGRPWLDRWRGTKTTPIATEKASMAIVRRRIAPVISGSTAWQQCWRIFKFDVVGVLKSVAFLVMLIFATVNFIAASALNGQRYGTKVYPVTEMMLSNLTGTFAFLLIIVVAFYSGELIFKERQTKTAEVIDAMPMPNWVPLLAKSGALVGVVFCFMTVGVVAAMGFQLFKGGVPLEPALYLQGSLQGAAPFVLIGLFGLAMQVIINNKFVGYLAMILLMVAQVSFEILHFDHNLYFIGGLPILTYSQMNGYGHFLTGWRWFLAYWSLFVLALLIVAHALWVRGNTSDWRTRARLARQRLVGDQRGAAGKALALSLCLFIACGGWIFYNTNVLNEYVAGDVVMDRLAEREKRYRKYKDIPQPRTTDIYADVDIYPSERRIVIKGHYLMTNKHDQPIDTLVIEFEPTVVTTLSGLPAHTVETDDQVLGMRILKLAQPLVAGASLKMNFDVLVSHQGFTNAGKPNQVNYNGTFFNNAHFFPNLGYVASELMDRNERRKRGLGEPHRAAKLEDEAARRNHQLGVEADWVNFETTVSTSGDQIALAPGYLQDTWEKDGRRFYHYKMDRPMLPFFAYLSANWQVETGDWNGLPIEIYHDAQHTYNVDRMITSVQKSLDYFSTSFTPYQHKQVRILEFPGYLSFAQAFANTIPYSESVGFIADLRDKHDIDYVFYITAHEMAHQWWAHQVVGANVQGATMLTESLAQYSALMVMEKEYGREHMRRFLKEELDSYLRSRRGEQIEELPLYRVENQPYIHYRKGALVFYRLREEIGEANLNRALKKFLIDKGYQSAPYTTTRELLTYLRAEAPAGKQELITDLFERIVFYDNRVTEATTKQRPDGKWEVTMKLHLAKLEADGKGQEAARKFDEAVEIAIFSRPDGGKESDEKVLFADKRVLDGNNPVVTIIVDEKPYDVGVDPYNKMIDRVSADNRKQVTVE